MAVKLWERIVIAFVLVSLAAVLVFMLALLVLPHLAWSSSSARSAVCANNVNMIGRALREYAAHNGGILPPNLAALRPKHVSDEKLHSCPFDKQGLPASSYVYIPATGAPLKSSGRGIILYCAAPHPDVLTGPGRDPHPGGVTVLYEDFSVAAVPKKDFTVPVSREAAPKTADLP